MSGQKNESPTVIATLYGGTGGVGGAGGVTGGAAGKGGGATMKINSVQNMTNHIGGSLVVHNDKLKEDLSKWLESPPDTKDRQHDLRKQHHESTGRWLLHHGLFVRWKDTPGSFWIKGISGTGKSVLSSTIIEAIVKACSNRSQSAVAFFYFDFRNERQHMNIMLRSIIWQLSGQAPSPYSALHQLYKTLKNGAILPQHVDLLKVLKNVLSELHQTYIVIDGLDECNKTDWKHLIQFIDSLCHLPTNAPHLLFTSQPLEEFHTAFKDVTSIELGSAVSTRDIRSYIASEVPMLRNWASNDKYVKHVTEQIVQKSNGMFRMAACLLIELEHCYEDQWQETLTALPSDLFGVYSRFLNRAKAALKPAFIQAIFRWLVFSARQVTSDELADAISFPLDTPGFDFSNPAKSTYFPKRRPDNSNKLKLLEGLIVIKNGGSNKLSIAFAHSSVKDYILSSEFQQKFDTIIDLKKNVSHKFLAQTCLRYLLLFADPKHSMTKDTLPDYPISLYAAEYWFHHLQLCNDQDQKALLPLTMHLLEDGSSQYAALYQLHPPRSRWDWTSVWDEPILPAVSMCYTIGYTQGVHSLLIEHNTCVDVATKDGNTALHLALEQGHINFAQLLIEHNASVDLATKDGKTALHLALERGHINFAQLLIEHNASVDLATKDGKTALHLALEWGHINFAQLLIQHNASVDLATKHGWTALHLASWEGHLEIAQLLIQHNASLDLATEDGKTALHLALEEGHLDIAQLLIKHNAPVDLATKHGWTALQLASWEGHLDIAQLLIEHNASIDLANKYGWTALHLALEKGHLNIARLFRKHNVFVDPDIKNGKTVLHHASEAGQLNIVQMLIEHNAFVNLATTYRMTALHFASEKGHLEIARLLIKHNAVVDLATTYGMTALHLASVEGHLDIVQLLIEHNASVDLATTSGMTALHLSLEKGHLAIAQLLIEHNASVNLATIYGTTALHLASARGHLDLDLVQLLIKHGASTSLEKTASKTLSTNAGLLCQK